MNLKLTKILLIESNPGDIRLIKELLTESGEDEYQIAIADSVMAGSLELAKERFDLIMLDLELQESHGLDTLTRMLAQAKEIPIVVLAGLDDEPMGTAAVNLGAQDFLVKGQATGRSLRRVISYAIERVRAEEKFKAIFNTTGDGILIADISGKKFLDGNRAICDMLGYTPEEIKTLGLADIHPRERLAVVIKDFDELPENDNALQLDIPLQRKDGSTFYADINSTVIMLAGKKCRFGIFRDATKRINAEEALHTLNEDLRIAQRLTKIGNWKWIIETNQVTWSEELCHINGWDPNVPVPPFAEMEKFYTPDSWKKLNEAVTKAFSTGEPYEVELEQVRTDGTRIMTFSRGECNFDANRKLIDLHGTVQDITQTRQLQEQLIAQDRLASIGQLVSGVAHEINNPLTSVIGFSELLLQKDLPEDVKWDLKIINDEAQRTSKIVKNLLTFARRQPEGKTAILINEQIDRVLALRNHEQTVNNIRIITNFAPDLPQINGNPSQLQQVFFNIIVNAEQAMLDAHKKGKLTVTTERVGDVIKVSFVDDGPGISSENKKKLFTPFFTTKGVGKGTGLGLSICHGIVTELGGKIYAESEPGQGAAFILEFPVNQNNPANISSV